MELNEIFVGTAVKLGVLIVTAAALAAIVLVGDSLSPTPYFDALPGALL